MEFERVVRGRHSVRQFKDQPVEVDLIKEIVSIAQRAPSWVNSQPWQVYCATGDALTQIKLAYQKNDQAGVASNPDLDLMERTKWAKQPQANMEQWRHDIVHYFPNFAEAHAAMTTASDTLYNSPAILFITIPKAAPDWSIFDAGAFAQTLMLAATARGLGSIVTYSSVRFPEVLRQVLSIPSGERIIAGVSIGYQADEAINHFRSQREPLDNVLHIRK